MNHSSKVYSLYSKLIVSNVLNIYPLNDSEVATFYRKCMKMLLTNVVGMADA